MYHAGIDIGSTTTKAVVIDEAGIVAGRSLIRTGFDMRETSEGVLNGSLEVANLPRAAVATVTTTGYGRYIAERKDSVIPEVIAIGYGLHCTVSGNGHPRTVLDIGGQDTKVIKVNPNGTVVKFVMNDMCAAGTGRFLENIARALGLTQEEMIAQACRAHEITDITSRCTVFAESEVITLLSRGHTAAAVLAGVHQAMIKRTITLLERVGVTGPLVFTGGVARNEYIVRLLAERYGPILVPEEPQFIGAIGAARLTMGNNGNGSHDGPVKP